MLSDKHQAECWSNGFTPTQQAMLAILKDGGFHTRDELIACIDDPEPHAGAFHQALFRLREKLRPMRLTVTCEPCKFKFRYRLMGLYGREKT
jgi:hypothetical protein